MPVIVMFSNCNHVWFFLLPSGFVGRFGGYGWHWGCNESEREPRGAATLARCSCSAQAAHFLQETLWGFGKKTQCVPPRRVPNRTTLLHPMCCTPSSSPPLQRAPATAQDSATTHVEERGCSHCSFLSTLQQKKNGDSSSSPPSSPPPLFSPFF